MAVITEVFDNAVSLGTTSLLNEPLLSTDTVLKTMGPASTALQAGRFRVVIVNPETEEVEYALVTSGQNTAEWQVQRGVGNTTAKNFPQNSIVKHILTVEGLVALINQQIVAAENFSSPMQFGAVGGGIVDDGAAVQEAIDFAQNGSGELLIDRAYAVNRVLTYDQGKPLHITFTAVGKWIFNNDFGIPAPTALAAVAQAGVTTFPAQTNYYRVWAYNSNGQGIATTEINVVITAGQQVHLTWNAPVTSQPISGYRISRGTTAYEASGYIDVGNVTAFTDTNQALTNGSPPTQGQVYAFKAVGTGQFGPKLKMSGIGGKIVGPGGDLQSHSPGAQVAFMHGIQMCSSMTIEDIWVTGFNAGRTFWGDHQRCINMSCVGNRVGEYYEPDPGGYPGTIGDQEIRGGAINLNSFCSTMVSGYSNPIANAKYDRVHYGYGPIDIYLEASADNPLLGATIDQLRHENCYFEATGNALLYDEAGTATIIAWDAINCPGYWQSSYTLAGKDSHYNIRNAHVLERCSFDNVDILTQVPPGSVAGSSGLIWASFAYHVEWRNGGEDAISNARNAGINFYVGLDPESFFIEGAAKSEVMSVADTSTLYGSLVELASTPLVSTAPSVSLADGNAPIIGIAEQGSPSTVFGFSWIPVAISGRARVSTVAGVTKRQYLISDPNNQYAVSSQSAIPDGTRTVVGVSLADAAANSLVDALIRIQQPTSPVVAIKTAVVPAFSGVYLDSTARRWNLTINGAFNMSGMLSNPPAGKTQLLTVEMLNNTAGALGAPTWDAIFIFAGIVWVNPAAGKRRAITFEWNGANWVALTVTPADY